MGKATTIYAINGSAILLPCTFSSCYGFENLYFRWSYNNSETSRIVSGVLISPHCLAHGGLQAQALVSSEDQS